MGALAEMIRSGARLERLRLTGAVLLTVAAILIAGRQQEEWDAGVRFLVTAVPCAWLYLMAASVARPGQALERWQTALAICGLALLLLSLIQLADMLGGGDGSGTGFWVTALIAAAAATIAFRYRSAIHTLIAALFAVVSVLYFIDWASDDLSIETARNVFVAFTLIFWFAAFAVRAYLPDLDRLHSDYLVVAGGLAGILAGSIGVAGDGDAVADALFGGSLSIGSADGWELFLLSVSMLLIYYTAWQGYRGSSYLGIIGLVAFLVPVASGDGIGGWPLILLLAGAGGVIASLFGQQLGLAERDRSQPGEPPPPDTLQP